MWRTVQNINWVQDFIKQRMKEKGYENFHFEFFELKIDQKEKQFTIDTSNEFYYPVAMNTDIGTIIASDVAVQFVEDKLYLKVTEHSGYIQVKIPNPGKDQLIQFIRVIPK